MFGGRQAESGDRLLALLVRDVAREVPRVHDRWLGQGPAQLWTLLESLVDDGKRRGEFRPDADGAVAARVLISGLMLQLMWQQHAPQVAGLAIDSDRLIDSSTEAFLAALRPTGSARRATP